MKKIIFITGFHCTGKSTIGSGLSQLLKIAHYSSSQLIYKGLSGYADVDKPLHLNFGFNQTVLLNELSRLTTEESIILDGHTCLIDEHRNLYKISLSFFKSLPISIIIAIKAKPEEISKRLYNRDNISMSSNIIKVYQETEVNYARLIAKKINAFYVTFNFNEDFINIAAVIRKKLKIASNDK